MFIVGWYIVCIHNFILNVFGVESKVSGVAHYIYHDQHTKSRCAYLGA